MVFARKTVVVSLNLPLSGSEEILTTFLTILVVVGLHRSAPVLYFLEKFRQISIRRTFCVVSLGLLRPEIY